MSQYGSYGPRGRAEQRKKKRNNLFINGAIAVVIIGIVFVSGMLIFGGDDSESAMTNNENENNAMNDMNEENEKNQGNEENEENENNEQENENDSMNEENNEEENTPDTSQPNVNDQGSDDAANSENDTNANEEDEDEIVYPTRGFWQPIGTVQEEPFAAVYEKDHINWQEMTRALQYATGLGDDMIIWRLGNGGDHLSAEGYVSNSATANTPFKVRIEWVTNKGWKPVTVEKLTENPYRTSSSARDDDVETADDNNTN